MEIIESVEKIRSLMRITFDDGSEYFLSGTLFDERPFSPGDTVNRKEFEKWLLLRQYRPALAKAVELLAMRPCSENEIRSRLRHSGYMAETVSMVILKLNKEGFLNDTEFAKQYAASRSERLGTFRIRQDLLRKGVDSETVEETLAAVDPDIQLNSARHLVAKALRNVKSGEDPRKTRQKLFAMLARKGYSYDTGKEAIDMEFPDND